ncbi:MAG: mechanosensitive ion channel family protein [Acidobacteriota bacterium]|nr:mechanosensitive ion channel family protein [Blastocatellia bacterium]MDW8411749.1 mechanosensitive ion channel family protein [Acidobacteriota bacterium]
MFNCQLWTALSFDALTSLLFVCLFVLLRLKLPLDRRSALRFPLIIFFFALLLIGLQKLLEASILLRKSSELLALVSKALLLIALARAVGILVMEILFVKLFKQTLSRITQDILQVLAYAAVVLLLLRSANVDPSSIVLSSAIVSAAVGLALQDTLGNLAAGLALQAQRPFEVGDWIQLDGQQHIGEVTEINWRATKILTLDKVEVVIPNGAMAKNSLLNYTKPTKVVRRNIYVYVPYRVPPRKVHEVILNTISSVPDVLSDPAPSVVTNKFTAEGLTEYWVRFFIDCFGRRDIVDGSVRERIWYALEREGLDRPYATSRVLLHREQYLAQEEKEPQRELKRYLEQIPLLALLSENEIEYLIKHVDKRFYLPGEIIIRQGQQGSELFILSKGEVAVTINGQEVNRICTGGFFGEMSLLTGERCSASVTAISDVELLVVSHEPFREILRSNSKLCEEFSRTLAKRQVELDSIKDSASVAEDLEDRSLRLLARIRDFFAV